MNDMTTPFVPHTVLIAWQIYVQYAVPLLFAYAVKLRFKSWLRSKVSKNDRKAMLRKNYRVVS